MRQDAEFFGDREAVLIYIAARLSDAQRLETVLDDAGIDYAVEAKEYRGGVIFTSVRTGAFFYVLPENAGAARDAMARHRFRPIAG